MVKHEEMASRVQEALEFVGMSEFKDREPARLSGGQKQRLSSDCRLQLACMKSELLVIADQHAAVNNGETAT